MVEVGRRVMDRLLTLKAKHFPSLVLERLHLCHAVCLQLEHLFHSVYLSILLFLLLELLVELCECIYLPSIKASVNAANFPSS